MIIYRQCTLCVPYHSLLEAPLDLKALGLNLYIRLPVQLYCLRID